MREILPAIDFAVCQAPRAVILELAEIAAVGGEFDSEVELDSFGMRGFDVANIRCKGTQAHEGLGYQLIVNPDVEMRVAVEIRASRWNPDDPPKYKVYCDAARELVVPVLRAYNQRNGTRYRLRIPTPNTRLPKLTPASEEHFQRFAVLANTSLLHPLDWQRFYQFVWKSRSRPMSEDDMAALLVKNGFARSYAERIATIYLHLCEFKRHR